MAQSSPPPEHVVVVGAGMVGLSTAWYLQRAGIQVTVVDRTGVAAGSSWGNAGWLAPALTLPLPEPAILATGVRAALSPSSPVYVPVRLDPRLWRWLVAFARHCTPGRWERAMRVFNQANADALDAYDDLAGDGLVEPIKPAEPFLAAFTSEADRATLLHELDQVARTGGYADFHLLERDELHALEPAFGDTVSHGMRLDGQRFINPGRFVAAVAEAIEKAGGHILADVDVERVDADATSARVVAADGRVISADHVVIANGSWLDRLARPHGVRHHVQAGRGYSFTVHPEHVPSGPVYFPAQRVACTPLGAPEEGLRVAGMMEFRSPDAALDPRRIKAIVDAARPMFTDIDWSARTDEWVGARPCTADGLPLVGPTRTPRVHVAGGHGMWGIALGPLTGRLLADQIISGSTPDLLKAFNPLR